jgi:hypothetical protein
MLGALLWALAVSLGAIDSTMKGLLFLRATCVYAFCISAPNLLPRQNTPLIISQPREDEIHQQKAGHFALSFGCQPPERSIPTMINRFQHKFIPVAEAASQLCDRATRHSRSAMTTHYSLKLTS